MLVSLAWLKKYVNIPVDVPTLVDDLTMTGLNVEHATSTGIEEQNIVVARVLDVSKHPNADKLTLCRVTIGSDKEMDVVCGAPNVAAGQIVALAVPGALLPDGTKIRSSKIRGVVSNGMICSERELGIGDDAAGIMVLETDAELGTPVAELLANADTIIEIEVTPNRPDHISHIGVAREAAAIYKTELKLPDLSPLEGDGTGGEFQLAIENGADCPRYVGRVIRGIKVGPSPRWLIDALEAVGHNSINNIVDIANYVMLELGQPLHAFDLHTLGGPKIIVRRAVDGETLLALDDRKHELNAHHLIIADDRVPVALAGIIGGAETMVTEKTKDILLESACFHPTVVRKGRKALDINTDASYRFERGSDREMCLKAADRAARLIMEVAGGTAGEVIDLYEETLDTCTLTLRSKSVKRLLGLTLSNEEVSQVLEPLGFTTAAMHTEGIDLEVPSYRRHDVREEADLIEEVARGYGYNRIGVGWDYRSTSYAHVDPFDAFIETMSSHFVSRGFSEVVTSAFTSGAEANLFEWPEGDVRRRALRLRNPLVSGSEYMRTSLFPSMLDVVRRNLDQGVKRINIFQVGKVFLGQLDKNGLPEERNMLALVMTRPDSLDFWSDLKKATDLFDIKKEIEIMARVFKIDIWHDFCYSFDRAVGQFSYSRKNDVIITGGVVPERVLNTYDFEQPVWIACIDLVRCYKGKLSIPRFKPLPEFPVSKRDLSLIATEGTTYQQIEKSLVKNGAGLIESIQLFDVYRGDTLPDGATAYGIRLQFRAKDKTLTDEEIDGIIDRMIAKLERELNVTLRS